MQIRRFVHLIPLFFFNDTATTEIYTLSLHDALPISIVSARRHRRPDRLQLLSHRSGALGSVFRLLREQPEDRRSEEHTSELQSHHDLVCRLLLEKKKNKQKNSKHISHNITYELQCSQ